MTEYVYAEKSHSMWRKTNSMGANADRGCNVHEDCQGSKQDTLEAEAYCTHYLCLFLPARLQDVAWLYVMPKPCIPSDEKCRADCRCVTSVPAKSLKPNRAIIWKATFLEYGLLWHWKLNFCYSTATSMPNIFGLYCFTFLKFIMGNRQ